MKGIAIGEMSAEERLEALSVFMKQENYNPFVYFCSDPLLETLGFRVARALIPELFPLYLIENEVNLEHPRLHALPRKLGVAIDENRFNPLPHPFP